MKKRFSATKFSKKCVLYCLAMCTLITLVVLIRAELTSATIGIIMSVWGGELILLLLQRILGGQTSANTKKSTEDTV